MRKVMGWTLVELLIVVVIIGILVSLRAGVSMVIRLEVERMTGGSEE